MRNGLILISLSLLVACGPRGGKSVSPSPREFPSVEIPMMLDDPAERTSFATAHFWDRFTDTAQVFACDSALVNGVPVEAVESQVGLFTTLLGQQPLAEGSAAMVRLYDRLDAFIARLKESGSDKIIAEIEGDGHE